MGGCLSLDHEASSVIAQAVDIEEACTTLALRSRVVHMTNVKSIHLKCPVGDLHLAV